VDDIIEHDEWEVCDLWHDGKHEKRLSIRKDSDHRWTYCMTCGISRKFVRKPAEGTEQQVQADSQANSLT